MTRNDYSAFDFVINSYLEAERPSTVSATVAMLFYALGFTLLSYDTSGVWLWATLVAVVLMDQASTFVIGMYLSPKKIPKLVAEIENNEARKTNLKKVFRRIKFSAMAMLLYTIVTVATGFIIAVNGHPIAATVWTVNGFAFVYFTWYFQRDAKLLIQATEMLKKGHVPNVGV
jgi:uncharacterized membrane protein HdeD (DUF308 family)